MSFMSQVALQLLLLLPLIFAPIMTHADTEILSFNPPAEELLSKANGLDPIAMQLALDAYNSATERGLVKKPYLTIIDYSKPSTEKRLWIFDLTQKKMLYELHVTHGKNSGQNIASKFSNKMNSLQTSLGTFITENTYQGRNGYSLRLEGLDRGVNDNAKKRGIVIHGASYATADYIKKRGRLGLSWGCPAIDKAVNEKVITLIKNGSVVFAYHPTNNAIVAAFPMTRVLHKNHRSLSLTSLLYS